MKQRRITVLLFLAMFTGSLAQEKFVTKDFKTRQAKACLSSLGYLFTFICEIVKYDGSTDEQLLKVECSECKEQRGAIEILSSLVGTIVKTCLDSEQFKILQPYVDRTIKLIKERNVSELNQLAVQMGNFLPIVCHGCKKSSWQVIKRKA